MEKMGRMTAEDKMLMDFERRRMKEALRRLEKLMEDFDLNRDILNQFKKGALSYCFPIPVDGMPLYTGVVKCFDRKWREEIEKFELKRNALVYLALVNITPYGEMLSMLYVSSHEEEWEYEGPTEDCVAAYVYNFDMGEGEFGDIFLTSNEGVLIRKA